MSNKIIDKCSLIDIATNVENNIKISRDRLMLVDDIYKCILDNMIPQKLIKNNFSNNRFEISFIDNTNIDTKSDCFIDYRDNKAKTNIASLNSVNFNVNINSKDCTKILSSGSYVPTSTRDIKIEAFFNSKVFKDIYLDIAADDSYMYVVESDGVILASGTSFGVLSISIEEKAYKDITITLLFSKHIDAVIRAISFRSITYKTNGSITSSRFKLYGSTSSVKVEALGSGFHNLLGVYNGDKIVYFDASTSVKISDKNSLSKNIVKAEYETVDGLKKIIKLSNTVNCDSVSLYSGYNRYRETLITGAFVNDDLTVTEYKDTNIIRDNYSDIDDIYRDIAAGELIVLKQKVYVEKATTIIEPIPKLLSGKDLQYIILINGNRCVSQEGVIKNELQQGINNITIKFYLAKKNNEDISTDKVFVGINLRKYSGLIYDFKFKKETVYSMTNNFFSNGFAISYDKDILIKRAKSDDSFLVTYDTYIDSQYHKTDGQKQYIECVIKTILESDTSYVSKIFIE